MTPDELDELLPALAKAGTEALAEVCAAVIGIRSLDGVFEEAGASYRMAYHDISDGLLAALRDLANANVLCCVACNRDIEEMKGRVEKISADYAAAIAQGDRFAKRYGRNDADCGTA